MEEKTYRLHIHETSFNRKPGIREIPKINAEIISSEAVVTQQQLADLVGDQGKTMVLATMNGSRKKENMTQMQVVAIDFDNTETRLDENGKVIKDEKGKAKKFKTEGTKYTSIEDALKDEFINRSASFVYKTFSHTDGWDKFRVVFFLDRALENNKQVEAVYEWLMDKYPNADKSTKDSSRLFFGGTEVIEINFDNELKTSEVTIAKTKRNKPNISTEKLVSPTVNHGKKNSVKKLKREESVAMFESYIHRESTNLQDYSNALSAIWVIGKAARTGEISFADAEDYCKMMALGDKGWEDNNLEKLQEVLNLPIHEIRTEYTFSEKFGGKRGMAIIDKDDLIATSKFLVDALDIKLYKNRLFFKNGNHWIPDDNKLIRAVDAYVELKRNQDNELIAQFMKRAELIEQDLFPIQFRNHYTLNGTEVIAHDTDGFTPYLLDVEYDPTVYDKDVDDFLNFLTMDRKDLRLVVEEMIGHMLMTQGFPHKVFFFIGEKGSNGKSTFLEMLNSFVGELGTNINLENFNDPTSVGELEGKLVNIGDDIDASFLEKSMNFKTLASGNTIMIRPIYQKPYRLKNRATLIFTANEMPTFKDKTGGIARRLVIIPCDNEVKKADFKMDEKLSTDNAKTYLLNIALKGLLRIQANGGKMTESHTINDMVEEYIAETDSIIGFMTENDISEDMPISTIYDEYKRFCENAGQKPFSQTKFTQRLKTKGYEVRQVRRMGKKVRTYKKE